MRLRTLNNKGFTLIELLLAAVIMVIVISGSTASLISTMGADKQQRTAIYAQDLLKNIINEQVRNKPFMAESNGSTTPDSLCGNPSVVGTVANQLRNGTVTSGSQTATGSIPNKAAWIRTYSDSEIPDLKRYYSKSATATLIIRPIRVSNPDPALAPITYYSATRVEVTARVRWAAKEGGNASANRFLQAEMSTIATSNGSYDKSLQPVAD